MSEQRDQTPPAAPRRGDTGIPRTGRTDAARPWADQFAESRDREMLGVDRPAVRRQVDGLATGGDAEAWRERTAQLLVSQRAAQPELPQIELLRDRRGLVVPVVTGALLVRPEVRDDPGLWALLQSYGDAEPVPELDDRLVRITTSLSSRRLDGLARFVRESGYEASVTHVTPLGPLLKGAGGAEQTAGRVPFPTGSGAEPARAAVTVAVIDTGIASREREDGWLSGLQAADGSNTDPLDAIPLDGLLDLGAGHGTFAAGVVQQVAPMAQLLVLRAVRSDGIGDEVDVAIRLVEAMRSADRDAPLIINLSLGAETVDDQPLLAIEVALEIVHEVHPDVLVVAAAGNSGSSRPCFPAASRSVVAVAALGADLGPAEWTNRGFWVDCAVVGEGILSTYVPGHESLLADDTPEVWDAPNPWALWSGTSFAAPQIAGAVARRIAEAGGTTHEALAWLFAQAPRVPDVGRVLVLLPGTPLH